MSCFLMLTSRLHICFIRIIWIILHIVGPMQFMVILIITWIIDSVETVCLPLDIRSRSKIKCNSSSSMIPLCLSTFFPNNIFDWNVFPVCMWLSHFTLLQPSFHLSLNKQAMFLSTYRLCLTPSFSLFLSPSFFLMCSVRLILCSCPFNVI